MTTKAMTAIAIALATLLSSPAFAKSTHSSHRSWDVHNTNGRYAGSDPDPNVRAMIARDHVEQRDNGF